MAERKCIAMLLSKNIQSVPFKNFDLLQFNEPENDSYFLMSMYKILKQLHDSSQLQCIIIFSLADIKFLGMRHNCQFLFNH